MNYYYIRYISASFAINGSEEENIGLIQSGDIEAFSALFRKYYKPLYFFAGRFVRDPDSAESLVQDVFVKFWENRSKITISTNLKSYLYTSVKNHCLNIIKRESKVYSFEEEEHHQTGASEADKIEVYELNKEVHKTIARLPEKCRQIFMMCKFDELSYQEIAEIQNISINTVKTQLKRAMKFLTENLAHLRTILIFLQFMAWHYFLNK